MYFYDHERNLSPCGNLFKVFECKDRVMLTAPAAETTTWWCLGHGSSRAHAHVSYHLAYFSCPGPEVWGFISTRMDTLKVRYLPLVIRQSSLSPKNWNPRYTVQVYDEVLTPFAYLTTWSYWIISERDLKHSYDVHLVRYTQIRMIKA